MRKLFTYKFDGDRGVKLEDYLYDMMDATQDGKLYIARTIDENGAYYEVAETEEDMNCVSVVEINWGRYDIEQIPYKFDFLIEYLQENKEENLSDIKYYLPDGVRAKAFEQRAKRLHRLFKIKAPRQVIAKEKHSLYEEMIFNHFGTSYQDIILVSGFNPPEKGSRADLGNKRVIRRFIDGYEDITKYIAEKKDFRFVDFQRELRIGYSFADYAIDNLEANGFVSKWQGNCIFQGIDLKEFERIEIDATPYDKDARFLDETSEEEILKEIENIEKGGK